MTRRRVVLHVTESYGAGTATAIHRFVRSVPEVEHHLLRRVRSDSSIDAHDDAFASVTELPAPGLGALRTIRTTARRIRPTAVHLHSSIGGALGRSALAASRDRALVYSPHCFAFERRDLSGLARLGLRAIESVLSFNTTVTAACSSRERRLAEGLRPGARAIFVPNVAPASRLRIDDAVGAPTVFSIGRAGVQKDPAFFASVAEHVHATAPDVRFVWIGGGEADAERLLRDAGVEVTGWLSDADAWPRLPRDPVYLHTAAWEGYPLAILEAQAAGIPIAARRIAALGDVDARLAQNDARSLAALVLRLLRDDAARAENLELWAAEVAQNSESEQRAALLRCYGLSAVAA